jgi:hypothetical protein
LHSTYNIEIYIDFLFSFYLFTILSFFFFYFFENFVIISWNFATLYCYVLLIWEIWRFLLYLVSFQWGTLSRRSYMKYCQQRQQDSSTKDVTMKEDDSQKLNRFQDSVCQKCVMITGYNWKYLIEEKNCELAASFGIFTYRFSFFCLYFFFILLYRFFFLGVLFWYKIFAVQ